MNDENVVAIYLIKYLIKLVANSSYVFYHGGMISFVILHKNIWLILRLLYLIFYHLKRQLSYLVFILFCNIKYALIIVTL